MSYTQIPSAATCSMYPPIIDTKEEAVHSAPPREQLVLNIPGATVNLIQREKSAELAYGDLSIVALIQGDDFVAVSARLGDKIQWPLAKDLPVVKLDAARYSFTLRVPAEEEEGEEKEDLLCNCGLTIPAKGQEAVLKEFDSVLETYSHFSVNTQMGNTQMGGLDPTTVAPEEMEEKRKEMTASSTAYWTKLAPNVDDYSGSVARWHNVSMVTQLKSRGL